MRRILSGGLRICVLIALLGLLIYFRFIDFSVLLRIIDRPEVLLLGAGAFFLSYVTGALRWWLILRSQRIAIAYFQAFQIYTVSIFLSVFIPGGTASADAVRMVALLRVAPGRRGQAVLGVFADRFVAILTLAVWTAALTIGQWAARPLRPDSPIFWLNIAALLLPLSLLLAAGAAWAVTRIPTYRARRLSLEQNRITRAISAMAEFADFAMENRLSIVLAIGASAITTGLLLYAILAVSAVAMVPNLSSWDIAYATALSQFANGLPISPGGIGVGEAAFNQICVWIAGGDRHYPYATIFLAYRVISLVVSCYGGLALLNVRALIKPSAERSYALPQSQACGQPDNL